MMVRIYAHLDAWRMRIEHWAKTDQGATIVEYIAWTAVVLVLLMGIMAVFSGQAQRVGQAIIDQILIWIERWGG